MPRRFLKTDRGELEQELARDHAVVRAAWGALREQLGLPTSWTEKLWAWEKDDHHPCVNLNRQNQGQALIWVACSREPDGVPECGTFALSTDDREHSRALSNLSSDIRYKPHVCFRADIDDLPQVVEFLSGVNAAGERRTRNYWLTTHWPQLQDNTDDHHHNIYLQDGKERYGADIRAGDKVMFYESKGGDPKYVREANGEMRLVRRKEGAEGIVTVAEVAGPLEEREKAEAVETYGSGKTRYWRWMAKTHKPFSNGFVSRRDVLAATGGRNLNYNMFGYGDGHSGLKRINKEQYEALLATFKENPRRQPIAPNGRQPAPGHWSEGGGEGPDHLALKEYVAANASLVLVEENVTTHKVEYSFASGDRADIVLRDHMGRMIGVEIEVEQGEGVYEGLLQAIKYRHMLAPMFGQKFDETRSLLVAHRVSKGIKKLCQDYQVQCVEVSREDVKRWTSRRPMS